MALPHVQGCATPHSHMEKAMGRPVALRAADMLAYRGCGSFLYWSGTLQKSCFTQSTLGVWEGGGGGRAGVAGNV